VGDATTLQGVATSISGSGATANVTVLLTSKDSVVVKASDCYAPQAGGTAIPAAVGRGGHGFNVGDTVTIPVAVSALVGTAVSVCQITCKTFSGTSVVVTGSTTPIFGGTQTVTVNYTLTATDVTNGYALIPITWPISFSNLNFTVSVAVTNLNADNVDPSNYYMGDIRVWSVVRKSRKLRKDFEGYDYPPANAVGSNTAWIPSYIGLARLKLLRLPYLPA
jgi:hypothetical protein